MEKSVAYLSITLLCAQLAKSCSLTNEMGHRCENHFSIVLQLMKKLRECTTEVNEKEHISKCNNEQLALCKLQIEAQQIFNKKITEQLAAYLLRIELQEAAIIKITEQLALYKPQIDNHDSPTKNIKDQQITMFKKSPCRANNGRISQCFTKNKLKLNYS